VIVGLSLSPDDSLAEDIAVGLVVVGTDAGTEEVSLVVAAECAPVGFAFGHEREAGLAGGAVELRQGVGVSALVGNGTKGGGDVAAGGLGAPDCFSRDEAAGVRLMPL